MAPKESNKSDETRERRIYGKGLKRSTFRIRPDQCAWLSKHGEVSKLVRRLIDQAMAEAARE